MATVLLLFALARGAQASPNVPLDDPRYDELAARRAEGALHLYLGGFAPLTEHRVSRLLGLERKPEALWLRLDRALLRVVADREAPRPFDTEQHHRNLVGDVAVTCEHSQGRPCNGDGILTEIDASAGYEALLSATLRLRSQLGRDGYDAGVAIDRAYVIGELQRIAAEVGRDVLVVGPRSRTQLGWGDHAPPIDHVRVSTSEPLALGQSVRLNVLYAIGLLRAPQRYPHALATISRVQVDVVDRIEIGAMELLQLGGDGAPPLGVWDFVLEHFRRGNLSATEADTSNRRFGGDITFDVPELIGARFYYQVVFEDIRRKRWMDAVRYDADHLLGLELATLMRGRAALVVEYQQTGVRSHEHTPRITGFTNAGRVVGSPLGPDAWSIYLAGRLRIGRVTLRPWTEYAHLSSDTYTFVEDGPISPATTGPQETRTRFGTRFEILLSAQSTLGANLTIEGVSNFAFEETSRTNAQLGLDVVWRAP